MLPARTLRGPEGSHRTGCYAHVLHERRAAFPTRQASKSWLLPMATARLTPSGKELEHFAEGVHGNAVCPKERRSYRTVADVDVHAVLSFRLALLVFMLLQL